MGTVILYTIYCIQYYMYIAIYDINVYVYQFILYLVHFSNVAEGMCHELCFFPGRADWK